jgi:hypothetical protein
LVATYLSATKSDFDEWFWPVGAVALKVCTVLPVATIGNRATTGDPILVKSKFLLPFHLKQV